MKYARSSLITLAVVITGVTSIAVARGQENRKDPSPAVLKKVDEVIALRVAPLQVEAETVGTVRKGDKLVVEESQGNWLWVRSGQTRGWIESTSVVGATLFAAYRDMAEGSWTQTLRIMAGMKFRVERVCAKVNGVVFDIETGGWPAEATDVRDQGGTRSITGPMLHVAIRAQGGSQCDLSVNGTPYGTVERGQNVLITKSREVFIDGFRRQPRG